MPLLQLTRRLAGRTTNIDLTDLPAERVIAQGRLALCVLSLIAVNIDPTDPIEYARTALSLLSAYLAFAAGLVTVTLKTTVTPRWRVVTHVVDVVVISSLLALTSGSASPFFAFFTFALLAATLRWNWPVVLSTAGVLASVFLLVVLTQQPAAASLQPNDPDLNRAIIRGAYLVVTGAMLAYVSAYRERTHERLLRLARWSAAEKGDAQPAFARALAHAASVLDSPRILVLWDEEEEPDTNLAFWSHGTYRRWKEPPGIYQLAVSNDLEGATFFLATPHSNIVQTAQGSLKVSSPIVDSRLVSEFEIGQVTTSAFQGTLCKGRLFVLGQSTWSDHQLLLAEVIAARIGTELDREALQVQTEQATVVRERSRLVRDIHDGLLQSLTAANLQLKLLADHSTNDVRSKLDAVKSLLGNEQRRVRRIVQTTRDGSQTSPAFRLDTDLRQLLSETAQNWNCKIPLKVSPPDASVSSALGVQVSFMIVEAVANAVRHGNASEVHVVVELTHDHLNLTIRDNGRGFQKIARYAGRSEADHTMPGSIHSRVVDLQGSLNLRNSQRGAELHINIPTT
jgi:signal transduction histidine kinase